MIRSKLAITTQENGPEVIADSSLNISKECLVAIRMLGEIRKGIKNKTGSIGVAVHKSIVRLCHLMSRASTKLNFKILKEHSPYGRGMEW